MTSSTMTSPSAVRSVHHCSLRSEKKQPAIDKLITLLKKVLLSSQSSSVGHVRTGRPVSDQFDSQIPNVRDPCRGSENERTRILLERQKEQIIAHCRAQIQRHEFPSRLWQKKYPNIERCYRVSMRRN